jgi:hypothetical protein
MSDRAFTFCPSALILSCVLGSSEFDTGNDGLLALRVGRGVSSSSRFLASSTSIGSEISSLLLNSLAYDARYGILGEYG